MTRTRCKQIIASADLPSRDEMLGTLLATFNAPISALARVLFAIQEQKEAGGGAAEAAPAEEAPCTKRRRLRKLKKNLNKI